MQGSAFSALRWAQKILEQRYKLIGWIFAITVYLVACAHPYRTTNTIYKKQAKLLAKELKSTPQSIISDSIKNPQHWAGTVNFNLRKPNFVVIHHTAQNSCEQTLKTFQLKRTSVSAHYVICKDGTIHHMLHDYLRAWHAGVGSWGGQTDLNSSSIGIELDNNGMEPFPEAQMNSLLALLNRLKKSYGIPTDNFIGHADLAPRRKNDPNIYFPWKLLATEGYGKWYKDTADVVLPSSFSPWQALRLVGYSLGKTNADSTAALLAFKRHWMQDSTAVLDTSVLKILKVMSDE